MSIDVLASIGFDEFRREEISGLKLEGECGRVVRVDRSAVSVMSGAGVLRIDTTPDDGLVVGDWVVVNDQVATRLERRTVLVRRVGPKKDERQTMAANVDVVVIVRGLDSDMRLNRLAALAVVAFDSGAAALVVLTKADLCKDPEEVAHTVSVGLGGIETITVSAKTGLGLDELRRRIAGRTVVLFGESGAGKSTLTNSLFGDELLATAEVRRDGQGRHTTTHRELVVIPSGGVIIDTPGIRDAAAFGDGHGLALAFADLLALAENCRFRDCNHDLTPGCAIEEAVHEGRISRARLEAYLHEAREQAWLEKRLDERTETTELKKTHRRREFKDRGPAE